MIHSAPGAGTRVEATVPLTSHPESSLIGMAEDRSSSSRSAVATR
jgi:hypothetical protein